MPVRDPLQYIRMARNDLPIQPSNGVIPKRPREVFEETAELLLSPVSPGIESPAILEVLVGLGVEEKPFPEALRVLVTPGTRHLGEPAASL